MFPQSKASPIPIRTIISPISVHYFCFKQNLSSSVTQTCWLCSRRESSGHATRRRSEPAISVRPNPPRDLLVAPKVTVRTRAFRGPGVRMVLKFRPRGEPIAGTSELKTELASSCARSTRISEAKYRGNRDVFDGLGGGTSSASRIPRFWTRDTAEI